MSQKHQLLLNAVFHQLSYISVDEAIFDQAARELAAITTADVRGQIIRRLPLPRHRRFQHCLDQFLYSNALLTAVEGDEKPILVLNVTDLKHGTAAAFVGGAFLPDVRKPELDDGTSTAIDCRPVFALERCSVLSGISGIVSRAGAVCEGLRAATQEMGSRSIPRRRGSLRQFGNPVFFGFNREGSSSSVLRVRCGGTVRLRSRSER